ncbi:MAG: kynureninase [Pyrinomonadaceae bacterium]|nr:kynureninase [Pyrinomonadaceae bacterium]
MSMQELNAMAVSLDDEDPLRDYRDRFHMPKQENGEDVVYMTGNSLGLQPKSAAAYIEQELEDWKNLGVEGHFHAKNPWMPYHEFLTEQMAAVIGAKPIETVVMNSLTVNLHLLMVTFYRPDKTRYKIMIEKDAFPSDRYAVVSQISFHRNKGRGDTVFPDLSTQTSDLSTQTSALRPQTSGLSSSAALVELSPRDGETCLRTEDILLEIEKHGDSLALIMLGGVNYYTGQLFDMKAITEAGHKAGAVVGFDLAHAAGNVELSLHDWNVDFAAWCSYKYLNSGPGGVAGIFVHEDHSESFDLPRFAGWWGHEKETRFLMGPDFVPMKGAEGWQLSNPPIFQMAALRASLEIFYEAGMKALADKSAKLTGFLEQVLEEINDDRISIITPGDPGQRGCQLSIRVKDSDRSLFEAITEKGVIADWREPDVIRLAPVPLYNSFHDCLQFGRILSDCLQQRD